MATNENIGEMIDASNSNSRLANGSETTKTRQNETFPTNSSTGVPNGANFRQGEYKSTREYAECLRNWMYQYRLWTAFATFQSALIASMPPPQHYINPNINGFQNTATQQPGRQQDAVQNTQFSTSTNQPGTRYRVPSLWKRVAAEFLDFILLFYTKLLVTFAFLKQTGYVHENLFEIDTQIPFFYDITEMDYDKMFTLTSELIALEVINRTCITIVETLCIQRGYAGSIGGATPGKKIMQLKVVFYEDIRDLGNRQILVEGARDAGFINAFLRSMIKNFSMAFFFPACFTVFLFRFNRAAYDVLTHTMVVETDPTAQQQNNNN